MAITTGQNADPDDFINESERDPTPANDAGKVVKLESTGEISKAFIATSLIKKIATDPTVGTEIADNTTTETNVFSETISAGLLGTDNAIRFKVYVSNFSLDSNASVDPVFRLKYGSTTLVTLTIDQSGSAIDTMTGWIEGVVYANASASAQTASMAAHFFLNKTRADNAISAGSVWAVDTGTATENSAGALTLALTIQWGNAQTINDFVPAGIIIEEIS